MRRDRPRPASWRGIAAGAALTLAAAFPPPHPALADECGPVEPQGEIARARDVGNVVLAGDAARRFAERLRGSGVPIADADRIFLFLADGSANLAWIDDAASPLAIRCDWTAAAGSPLAALIEQTIREAR
jgi:hypothetical protein